MRRLKSGAKNKTLFKCGVGSTQVAITPQGELKPCLMLDSPRYKILPGGLRSAWGKIKKTMSKITADKKFSCHRCNLLTYCKWCPAQSWLYNKTYTSCVPEFRRKAGDLKSRVG